MTKIDQFESAFRSADKAALTYEPVRFTRPLIVTDLPESDAAAFARAVRQYLAVVVADEWPVVTGDRFRTVRDLLDVVDEHAPDLICTYRHLHTEGWRWPYTLGDHLEVLTQVATAPVLVLPHPKVTGGTERAIESTNVVMAMTDHLTGDDRLVNVAAAMTAPGGTLYLTHVEDDATFERYLDVISKIDTIDTDQARETIGRRLLKEPNDYIENCGRTLRQHELDLTVEEIATFGNRLLKYETLVDEHRAYLLVLNTRDEDQMAMHGMAYPLAVELRRVPLLML